jgi:dethiobiotin synthetase
MQGLLITGSDTGVGKTTISTALLRLLRQQGRLVRACKPVATGAVWHEGRLLSEDTRLLAQAAGDDPDQVTPWTFAEPVAPPLAARRAGTPLELAAIARAVRRRAESGHWLLVEGIGGLLCPLTERETVADLAALVGLPLVVVVRRALGTLNHTLLTLEVARWRGLPIAGLIVNETTPGHGLAEETAADEMSRFVRVPILAQVSYHAGAEDRVASDLAAVDWWQLGRVQSGGQSES